MEIEVNTFYHCQPLYKYMPRAIFNALEGAFLEGRAMVEVPAEDYFRMKKEAPAEIWPVIVR